MTVKFANYQLEFFGKIYLLGDPMPCRGYFGDIEPAMTADIGMQWNKVGYFLWRNTLPCYARPMFPPFAFGSGWESP
jgi:hypothetical protein